MAVTDLAGILVKLYLGQGKIVEYLEMVCAEEIYITSNYYTVLQFCLQYGMLFHELSLFQTIPTLCSERILSQRNR